MQTKSYCIQTEFICAQARTDAAQMSPELSTGGLVGLGLVGSLGLVGLGLVGFGPSMALHIFRISSWKYIPLPSLGQPSSEQSRLPLMAMWPVMTRRDSKTTVPADVLRKK